MGNLIYILKSRLGILQSNAKSENGFHLQEIRPQCGFQLKTFKSGFRGFLYLPFEWENTKTDLQNVSREQWSFFLLIMRARSGPLSLRTVLKMVFRISPKKTERKDIQEEISQC